MVTCTGSAGGDSRAAETHQGTGSSEPRTGLCAGAAVATGLPRRGWRRRGRATCGAQCCLGKCVCAPQSVLTHPTLFIVNPHTETRSLPSTF
jgi:hypothetical protein